MLADAFFSVCGVHARLCFITFTHGRFLPPAVPRWSVPVAFFRGGGTVSLSGVRLQDSPACAESLVASPKVRIGMASDCFRRREKNLPRYSAGCSGIEFCGLSSGFPVYLASTASFERSRAMRCFQDGPTFSPTISSLCEFLFSVESSVNILFKSAFSRWHWRVVFVLVYLPLLPNPGYLRSNPTSPLLFA